MRESSSCRDLRSVIAFDYPSANAGLLFELERGLEQVGVQSGSGIEPNQSLRRSDPFQPAVANETANDRAVLLLDPGLIVLAVGARPCDLQTMTPAPGDDQFVHEQTIIVKVDASQWEREQRHCAGQSFDHQGAAARHQRQALGPAGGNVRQHHRLDKAAGSRGACMSNKIDLDKPWRRVVPIAERPHRHCAAHCRAEPGAPPTPAAARRTCESKRSIVAGLMASSSPRIVSSIASWPCRSNAGSSTGMIG